MVDWEEIKVGLYFIIGIILLFITVPSAMGLGLHLMTKLVPELTPACEVKK